MNFKQIISFLGTSLTGSESGSNVTDLIRTDGGAIRYTRGLDQLRAYAPARIGTEDLRLMNNDQAFSPGINPNVKPGKETLLSVEGIEGEEMEFMSGDDFQFMDGSTAESAGIGGFDLFRGLTNIFRHNAAFSEKSVSVNILDMLARLDKEISTAWYEDITIDEAIAVVLDEVNWPADERILDAATVTLTGWGLNRENAFNAIAKLVLTEGPFAWFTTDGSGNFIFKNNIAISTETVSTASQMTFGDTINALVEDYDDRALETILAVQVTQQEREAQSQDVIWRHEGDLVLTTNQEITLIISNPEFFINATEPSLVGVNAEQTLVPSVPLTGGTFIANVNGTDTTALNWNDSLATIQSAFDTAVGAGNSRLTGSLTNGLRVQFIGDLAAKAIPLITITSSLNTGTAPASINIQDATDGGNSKWKLSPSAPLSAGTYKIRTVNGNLTTTIPYNSNAALIKSRLEAVPLIDPGDVDVTGTGDISTDDQTIEYMGDLADQYVPTFIVEASSLRTATASTATLIVTETVKGGGPDVVISAGEASFVFPDRISGADVPLNVIAGASGATLKDLQIRGQIMKVVRERIITYPENTTLPDGQIFKPNIYGEIPYDDALARAMMLWERYNVPPPTETLVVKSDLRESQAINMLRLDIGHKVQVIGVQNGINAYFHIRQVEQVIYTEEEVLISRFGCEAA